MVSSRFYNNGVVETCTQKPVVTRLQIATDYVEVDILSNVLDDVTLSEKTVTCNNGVVKKSLGVEDFEVLKLVGQGTFGKVYQVRKRDTLQIYAMKVIRKDRVIEKNHVEYMKAERDILAKIDHPFIVRLRYSFQVIKVTQILLMLFQNEIHSFHDLWKFFCCRQIIDCTLYLIL